MIASSDYIKSMMENVQQLPAEVMQGKEKVYDAFLKSDFALEENKEPCSSGAADKPTSHWAT